MKKEDGRTFFLLRPRSDSLVVLPSRFSSLPPSLAPLAPEAISAVKSATRQESHLLRARLEFAARSNSTALCAHRHETPTRPRRHSTRRRRSRTPSGARSGGPWRTRAVAWFIRSAAASRRSRPTSGSILAPLGRSGCVAAVLDAALIARAVLEPTGGTDDDGDRERRSPTRRDLDRKVHRVAQVEEQKTGLRLSQFDGRSGGQHREPVCGPPSLPRLKQLAPEICEQLGVSIADRT